MATNNNPGSSKLVTPERNHFFYGKLMDVPQCNKEQRYFNQKHSLLNRLVLGSGVVCGLNIVANAVDLESGIVRILPGVAIDRLGREIVVPETNRVNPRQLTDERGEPQGEALDSGNVEICLAYAEKCADPVPVLVPDCDTSGNCAPSTVREGFRIVVRTAGEVPEPPACHLEESEQEHRASVANSFHTLLCERINSLPLESLGDSCVSLARVTLPLEQNSIDISAGRRLIYNNAILYELILCLAERVEALESER